MADDPSRPIGAPDPRPGAVLARWLYPYFPLAAATFLAGGAAGAGAMAVTPPGALAEASGAFGSPDLFPDTITTWTVFSNNVVALVFVAAGAVSFGLAAFAGLLFNGLVVGILVAASAAEGSLPVALALILPHGVIELPAFFLVGGATYRVTWRLVSYLRGADDTPITRREAAEAAALAFLAVLALLVAAWIEATLTVEVARALVGDGAVPG